jgi:hypothetical protein
MTTEPAILDQILKELKAAKKKHPQWPDHIVARAAIVGEEAGELMRAALIFKYERAEAPEGQENQLKEMEKEAIQTAATCIRFLECLRK